MEGQQILTKPCIKVDGSGPVDTPGEPGHGQAATDHAGFDFFSGISLSPKHQAAAGTRGRAATTPAFPLFYFAGREVPRCPCRTTVLVLASCTPPLQWPLQTTRFSYHPMEYRVHFHSWSSSEQPRLTE